MSKGSKHGIELLHEHRLPATRLQIRRKESQQRDVMGTVSVRSPGVRARCSFGFAVFRFAGLSVSGP